MLYALLYSHAKGIAIGLRIYCSAAPIYSERRTLSNFDKWGITILICKKIVPKSYIVIPSHR